MATISLTTTCSECAKNKKINRLMQRLGDDEVFCKEGHKFRDIDSLEPIAAATITRAARKTASGAGDGSKAATVAATAPATAPETAVAVADPPPNLEEVSPFAEFDDEGSGLPPAITQAVEEQATIVRDDGIVVHDGPVNGAILDAIPDEVELAHTAVPGVVPGSVREIEGKHVELRFVIPEQFVSMLKATAESYGKTMEEYFSEIVTNAFDSGWFW